MVRQIIVPPQRDFLTTDELSERWSNHVKPGTLENWRSEGKGPAYIKLGKNENAPIIYRLDDVIAYEKMNTITPSVKEKK